MKIKILFPCLFILYVDCVLLAQPGSLDNTFSSDGKVSTPLGSSYDYGNAVAIQSDGKIVVAGYGAIGLNDNFGLIRYTQDGTIDNTFGINGKVTTLIGSIYNHCYSVAIQNDGKIVAVGGSYNGTFDEVFTLVRYNNSGTMDSTFGSAGKVTTVLGTTDAEAVSVVIQSDGKIVAVGSCATGSSFDFAMVRYNSNGILDNTFGTSGKVTTDFGNSNDMASSVAIQIDGKIVVAGFSSGTKYNIALARYNSDGSLDITFSSDGKVTTTIGSFDEVANSVAIQVDGKILVAGKSFNGNSDDFVLVRYNSDGSLDNSFDNDGIVITDIEGFDDESKSLALEGDGKIIAVGRSSNGNKENFTLVRYAKDGGLDNTFGSGGKVTTAIGSFWDEANSVAIQKDGKIVVAGSIASGVNYDFAVARYNNYCSPAPSPICLVTVDNTSTKNEIVWEKQITTTIDSFRIYREIGLNNYVHIGSVAYPDLSDFTDTTNGINPQIQSYRYKISVIDTCQEESDLSPAHRTIHLSTPNFTSPKTFDLIWTNDYEGFPITQYYILRDGNNNGNWQIIDSVSFGNTSYTDINAPSDSARYFISAENPSGCTATLKTKTVNSTKSNTSDRIGIGTGLNSKKNNNESEFQVYPNPNKGKFMLVLKNRKLSNDKIRIEIINFFGEFLFRSEIADTESEITLPEIPSGLYQLQLKTKQNIVNKKLVIQ